MVGAIALADYETDEALATMREIEAMSQLDATDGDDWMPWLEAIERAAPVMRGGVDKNALNAAFKLFGEPLTALEWSQWSAASDAATAESAAYGRRWREDYFRTSDGDRPADLRDDEIRREMLIDPEYRAARRDPLGRALLLRRERGIVRETHAKVHRALGYDGHGVGGTGCKWCEESDTLQR